MRANRVVTFSLLVIAIAMALFGILPNNAVAEETASSTGPDSSLKGQPSGGEQQDPGGIDSQRAHQGSEGAIGTKSVEESTSMTAAAALGVGDVCGTIDTNRTWSPAESEVYHVTCDVVIAPGATLTLAPGTIVKVEGRPSIYVEGSLVASGTAASPVTFTSWRDDSVGGDSNDDGDITDPARGDWGGIYASPAGGGQPNPRIQLGSVTSRYADVGVDAPSSSVSIVDSSFSRLSGDGIRVRSASGVPTITGNSVTSTGGMPISVSNSSIVLSKLDGNSGSGNGLNGVALANNTLSANGALPWTGNLVPVLSGGCSSLSVPAGRTLTLRAGTVVKAQGCASFDVQGSLVATGTSASPVVLTSWRDDTVAGDTNADADATAPDRGNWGGINAYPAGGGQPNPKIQMAFTTLRYADHGVDAPSSTVSINRSTFSRLSGDGIRVSNATGVPTITNNSVTSTGGTPITVNSSSVDLAKLNGNTGSGNGLNGISLANDTLSVSGNLPWTGNLVPVLSGGCSSLTVPVATTLTLGPGTVVKGQGCASIQVQGTLVGSGSTASPAVLTSWRDDTVGGDTNGDRARTTPAAGDWGGIYASPAGNGQPNPTIRLTSTSVRYADAGLDAPRATISVDQSDFRSLSGDGIRVTNAVGIPTITNTTVSSAGGEAISITGSAIDMAKLNGNNGTGNALNGVALANNTLSVSSSLPWTGNLVPVLTGGCSSLTVPVGSTLTLGQGTVIKGQQCAYVQVEGSLVASGTAASPVTFTSWRDDSVAGVTAAGAVDGPGVGDWRGIMLARNGTARLDGVAIRYVDIGLDVSDGGDASIHGSITHAEVGVAATSYVDASNVDWGSPSGPAPFGSGVPIQGPGVSPAPWVGWTPAPVPPRGNPGASPGGSPGPAADCQPVMFLGVRGSGELPYERSDDDAYGGSWTFGLGQQVEAINEGFLSRLQEKGYDIAQGGDQKTIALRYRALHVPFTDPGGEGWDYFIGLAFNTIDYTASIWQGVYRIQQYVRNEIENCQSSQRYVLAGYSQGALAIHIYLTKLATPAERSLFSAVGLLADPAKNRNGGEYVYTDGFRRVDSGGVRAATGSYKSLGLVGSGAIPSDVAARTASMCHDNDIVCAPGFGSWIRQHTNYAASGDEMSQFGGWLADRLPDRQIPPN